MGTIYQKLMKLQTEFKSGKNLRNEYAGFMYRKFENMMDELKPLLQREGLILFTDEMLVCGTDYMQITITLVDVETGEKIQNNSLVAIDLNMKGMNKSQASGAAVSYGRKYALGGLLALGAEEKDPDELPNGGKIQPNEVISQINMCTSINQLVGLWNSLEDYLKNDPGVKASFTSRKKTVKQQ